MDWDLRYDVIDLDPYGTVAPFIDSAIQVGSPSLPQSVL